MGQKVNPIGLRLGINRTWDSRWYANTKDYARFLHQDIKIRQFLREKLKAAGVSKIIIERPLKKCRVTIFIAKPGVVIGRKGADIEKLRKQLMKLTPDTELHVNLVEVRKPETDSNLVAEGVAQQLERRVAFRRAMKRAMQSAMRLGAQGIRINVSGRLGGAEIARMEWYREGRVPLHTLRADVDYGFTEADTAYGKIGVKVWIFKGGILEHDPMAQDKRSLETGESRERRDRDDHPRRGRRPTHDEVVFGVDGEVVDTRRSSGASVTSARGVLPGDREPSGQAQMHRSRRREKTSDRGPKESVYQIAREFEPDRFQRLLNRLLDLVTNPSREPDPDLTAELKWLGDQLRSGIVSVDGSARNHAKAVALNVASLIDDPSQKRQRAAVQYLIEFSKIISPPNKSEGRSDARCVELALDHFGIGYFLNASLTLEDGDTTGVYQIKLRDRISGLAGVREPVVLRGLRKDARVEAVISTAPGHTERRDLTSALPIDTSLTVKGIADAPYPALTLVIDGVIALQHRRDPVVATQFEDAWA